MDSNIPQTYRWQRRSVPRIRVTWLGMVAILMILLHQEIIRSFPMGMGGKVLLFIGLVMLPVLLLALWRQGLLPPERVPVDAPPPPGAPGYPAAPGAPGAPPES